MNYSEFTQIKKAKLKNIEILRFIFILQIIYMHVLVLPNALCAVFPQVDLYAKLSQIYMKAWINVDYFFVIAGFFLVYAFKYKSCINFIKSKALRLLPALFGLYFGLIMASFFIKGVQFNSVSAIFSSCFLGSIGIFPGEASYVWFISPLFFSLFFYFYLIKNYQEKNVNLVIAIITFFSYVLLSSSDMWPFAFYKIFNFITVGLLRGLGGVGLGYFVAKLYIDHYQQIIMFNPTKMQKLLFTLVEGFLLFYIIYFESFRRLEQTNFILLLNFLVLFWLFLIKKGFISKFLDNNISTFLGKYVYAIYVADTLILSVLLPMLPHFTKFINKHPFSIIFISMSTTVLAGILIYHVFECTIRNYFKIHTNKEVI